MRFNKWDSLTDEEKVAQVRREVEANTEPLPPLGEPHKEVWLVQAWDESGERCPTPLFSYAFTDRNIAEKVREAGLAVKLPYMVWTIDRVVLDAAEDAERVIDEMVAIDAGRRDEDESVG
jgi:hypothetical protein